MAEVLGVDIGGVIIGRASTGSTGPDTMFHTGSFLLTPQMPGAFNALRKLAQCFGDRIHLVSKASEPTQEKTRLWLASHEFYRLTGIGVDHVHFCLERAEKSDICRRLGVTHFVDDKLEVLSYLTTVPNRYLFRPNQREVQRFSKTLPDVTCVESWVDLIALLLISS